MLDEETRHQVIVELDRGRASVAGDGDATLVSCDAEGEQHVLHDTAARLVEAAKRIIAERGLAGLTTDGVLKESGVRNRAAIHYYFGGKNGLLRAIAQQVMIEVCEELLEVPHEGESAEERVDAFIRLLRKTSSDSTTVAGYFEIVVGSLRDDELRSAVGYHYRIWLEHALRLFFPEATDDPDRQRELMAFVRVVAALTDGIELQRVLFRDDADVEGMLTWMRKMLVFALR